MPRKKKAKQLLLTERDREILIFLWKFRTATSHALRVKFFRNASHGSSYRRLQRLKSAGFIAHAMSPYFGDLTWRLTKSGFKVVKYLLPERIGEGYLPKDVDHDLLVGAVLTGDWLKNPLERMEFVTDQELQFVDRECLPDWIPHIYGRRPDGFFKIIDKEQKEWVFSLEVELNRKSKARYFDIINSYQNVEGLARIFWIVADKSGMNILIKALAEFPKDHQRYHNIILLDDYLRLGWSAPISHGAEKGCQFSICLFQKEANSYSPGASHPFLNFKAKRVDNEYLQQKLKHPEICN